ncbi:type IV pilus biogenesis protein PilP [Candidatus Regiella endosymbiont of Tuberolachnus salignus]|uniref:type IV pilus biogenesis protein PilP n=1 Tax=Candidatus Regiella endosymbiont of Tuberolachnus salignus TaxID=3077956 RepID=UPI0030D3F42D
MHNVNLFSRAVVAIGVMLSLSSQATPTTKLPPAPEAALPPLPARVTTERTLDLARLERIQAETLLFEAQAARAKALQSVQQNKGGEIPVSATLVQTLAGAAGADLTPAAASPPLPRIVQIAGAGNPLRARLLLPDSTTVEVTPGQRIPGTSHTVKRISAQEVQILSKNNQIHTLPFTE